MRLLLLLLLVAIGRKKERSLSVDGSLLDSAGSINPGEEVPAQAPSGNGNGQIAPGTELERKSRRKSHLHLEWTRGRERRLLKS